MDPKLYKAATQGNMDYLQNLPPPEKLDLPFQLAPNQNTLLHVATEFRQLDFAKAVVGEYPSLLSEKNAAGDTPLHVAAREDLEKFVAFFIEFGTLSQVVNFEGDTALHCAAKVGSSKCIEELARKDPGLCGLLNNNGESPLYLAVAAGDMDAPPAIIDIARSLASYKGANGLTALHPTLFYSNYDIETIRSLVAWKKEMIKKRDDLGLTPLHYASLYGRTEAINLFLENEKSAIYILDNNGESALHIAAFQGHVGAVEAILKSCPDCCYLVDEKGRTALHAAVLGDQKEVVKFILKMSKEGCPMNKPDKDGNMPLHLAALFKLYGVIEILVKHNNHVNLIIKNKEFLTALDIYNKHHEEGLRASVTRDILVGSTGAMTMQHLAEKEIKKMNREITIEIPPSDDHDQEGSKIDGNNMKKRSLYTEKKKGLEVNLLVSTLVATVTFGAGFSMAGGYYDEGNKAGLAILSTEAGFKVFVVFNTLAFCCSVFAVLLQFHTSLTEYHQRIRYMGIAALFTTIAILAMVIAFASATYVVLTNSKIFSLTPFLIFGGFAFLYFALPFCDPGVEGFPFLRRQQTLVRGIVVRYIRYEE